MTKWYIGLEMNRHKITVFGEDRGDGVALAESGYDFVSGPYVLQKDAIAERDRFAKILTYGGE